MTTYDRIEDIVCTYVADVPEGLIDALWDFAESLQEQINDYEADLEDIKALAVVTEKAIGGLFRRIYGWEGD